MFSKFIWSITIKSSKYFGSIFFFESLTFINNFNCNFSVWGNGNIFVNISSTLDKNIIVRVTDEGQGFKEKDTSKIFKRFYSNRPDKFGEHSGLGLNIVKNLVDLHEGRISASNRLDRDGAIVEISFPSV